MDRLSSVRCSRTPIARTDVRRLAALTAQDFRDFYVPNGCGTSFTDGDVELLSRFQGLEIVGLENARISDHALKCLASLSSLRLLDLDGTEITDRGIKALSAHPRLEILWVEDCAISDGSIAALAACPNLKFVSLLGTVCTDSGMRILEANGVEVHA